MVPDRPIPQAVREVLDRLGITSPESRDWVRGSPCAGRFIIQYAHCDCRNPPVQIWMTWQVLGDRHVSIGQCPVCGRIHWKDRIPKL